MSDDGLSVSPTQTDLKESDSDSDDDDEFDEDFADKCIHVFFTLLLI